jgi:hypothetical protein
MCINGNMPNPVDALIAWTFDPERRMRRYLECLKDDLLCDDPEVVAEAEEKVLPLLEWLIPPRTAAEVSKAISEQQEIIRSKLRDQGIPKRIVEKVVKDVTTRERGRPRSRNSDAIAGLRLRWLERKEWREIVLEISGPCKDRGCQYFCQECGDVWRKTELRGRKVTERRLEAKCQKCRFRLRSPEEKELVCYRCSDRMANLVRRLEQFLEDNRIAHQPYSRPDQLREK